MSDRLYLLKIKLVGVEPEIYRRFVVPAAITLDRLHDVIQIVMGWQDYHLHAFTIGKKRYTEEPESREDGAEEGKYRLGDLLKQQGRTFRYEYDFGDNWEHEITLEDSRYINPELGYTLICLEGERVCPPEDVGGIAGYEEFCEAVANPSHEEHENYTEWFSGLSWYGGVFDSEDFDLGKVNYQLVAYLRWSRDRLKSWGIN